jgi:hypothetical protein
MNDHSNYPFDRDGHFQVHVINLTKTNACPN